MGTPTKAPLSGVGTPTKPLLPGVPDPPKTTPHSGDSVPSGNTDGSSTTHSGKSGTTSTTHNTPGSSSTSGASSTGTSTNDQDTKLTYDQILKQITDLQNEEIKGYNNLHVNPEREQQNLNLIQQLAQQRQALFMKLMTESTSLDKSQAASKDDSDLINSISSQLQGLSKSDDDTNAAQINKNNFRQFEINNYYSKRSIAYIAFFKQIIMACLALFIIALLNRNNIISGKVSSILFIIVIVIALVLMLGKYYDILKRDNMNFDEYDFGDANAGKGDGGGNIKPPHIDPHLCIDDACCSKGTKYDSKIGKCVPSN